MNGVDEVALLLPCRSCGARPYDWCVTFRPTVNPPGQPTTWLHEPRRRPAEGLWLDGFRAGRRAGIHLARNNARLADRFIVD